MFARIGWLLALLNLASNWTFGQSEIASPLTLNRTSFQTADSQNAAVRARPAYGQMETLPIDLPTVLRLAQANNPSIQFARARVREANARLEFAEIQWLPTLTVGSTYNRFDGQTQNQRGEVFGVSRSNLLVGMGPALSLDFVEAIYAPLVERRVTSAERLRERAATAGTGLDAINAYIDLLLAFGYLEINQETVTRAEAMLLAAKQAKEAKLDRSAGDVNRAQAEVLLRRTERLELESRASIAGSKLAKLLMLSPCTQLVPADQQIVAIELIDPNCTLEALFQHAIRFRPDLAAQGQTIYAARNRVEKASASRYYPKLLVANQSSVFGGGVNGDLGNYDGRNVLSGQLYWEARQLGLGAQSEMEIRRAEVSQQQARFLELQSKITSEIAESAAVATAKYDSLDLAEQAVREAMELYRITREGTLNVVDAKNLFDALRPLQAIQVLSQSQQQYLLAVSEFNRAQFRLFAMIGNDLGNAVDASESQTASSGESVPR